MVSLCLTFQLNVCVVLCVSADYWDLDSREQEGPVQHPSGGTE